MTAILEPVPVPPWPQPPAPPPTPPTPPRASCDSVRVPLSRRLHAIIDGADAELVGQFTWHANKARYTWYAYRRVRRPGRGPTTQAMHTLLTGYTLTDHINGDGLDNRRVNLRAATNAQNHFNMRKPRVGSSQFKGVTWDVSRSRWQAQIKLAQRTIHLGRFDDEEFAACAYDAAARELFGEYAAPNFPKAGENGAPRPPAGPGKQTGPRQTGPRPSRPRRYPRADAVPPGTPPPSGPPSGPTHPTPTGPTQSPVPPR